MAVSAKVNILHLSDLHFGIEPSRDVSTTAIAQRKNTLNNLITTLRGLGTEWRPDIVVISGDVGWKGKANDYRDAKAWINQLLGVLGLGPNQMIVCAGNHDIDRDKCHGMYPPSSSEQADEGLRVEHLDSFIRLFEDFTSFCREAGIPEVSVGKRSNHLVGRRDVADLRFIVINSSWFSRSNEDKGKLWIGLPQLQVMEAEGALVTPQDYDSAMVTVTVLHHPESWLAEHELYAYGNRPSTYGYLSERCHIILSGHTHGAIQKPNRARNRAFHFSVGATYAGSDYWNNFSILQVDINNRSAMRRSFEFDPRAGTWNEAIEQDPCFLTVPIGGPQQRVFEYSPKRITEEIVKKYYEKKKGKKWRSLTHLLYPVISGDDRTFQEAFAYRLAMSLARVFVTTGFTRFNGLLRVKESTEIKEIKRSLDIYYFICHQVEFCDVVRRDYEDFLLASKDLRGPGVKPDEWSRFQKKRLDELEAFQREWSTSFKIPFSPTFTPLELVYDPATRSISIKSIRELSVNPANYSDRVGTTSELLRFIGSLGPEPVVYLGDVEWYSENYPLQKLIVDVIDTGKIEFERIQINAEDYEEWDYINPQFDLEVIRMSQSKRL